MIKSKNNPTEWVLLIDELCEAKEHLQKLTNQMAESGSIDEEDFKIQIGHVYAHLNRACNTRNEKEQIESSEWSKFSQFPKDIEPCG